MVRSIKEYARDWQENAEADAFWSILTNPRFYAGKWNDVAFYKTGDEEINRLFNYMLKELIKYTASYGPQLDFKIEMHVLPFEEVKNICDTWGCLIEAHPATNSCERDHDGNLEFYDLKEEKNRLANNTKLNRYLSCMFFVRKPL